MARVYLVMFFLGLVLAVLALISCLSAEDGEVRGMPRLLWVLVILLFPLLGSLAYYFAGRPLTGIAGRAQPSQARRVLAPDDDPEFLRRLGRAIPPKEDKGPGEKPTST